ncbi:hypothetical protein ECDEC10A_1346 [Escherichia coli DEC10A]|nr:hypothetical protein ECDEC10A_1346 [Escherichia coli DEC10A]
MAEMKTTITETRNEITQTVSKTLEDQSATIQQIQRVQKDTNDDLAALYMLKVQKTKDGIPYVAGIGAGIEDTDGQPLSNILLLADRIAMINPESGNSTPLFVARGESAVHERRVPEATVCGEHHVIRQPPDVFPDAGRATDGEKCGYQWQCESELRDAQQRHD